MLLLDISSVNVQSQERESCNSWFKYVFLRGHSGHSKAGIEI